jgi:hypothetical protein
MDFHSHAARAKSKQRASLAARDEQSGNGRACHQILLAIRQARVRSASVNARQTISTGALSRLPAGKDVFLATAAAGLRILIYAIVIRG